MNRPAHLVAIEGDATPAPADPLAEARKAGNAEIDAALDAWAVSLMHIERAERFAELLPPGVLSLLRSRARTIAQDVLTLTAIRERCP